MVGLVCPALSTTLPDYQLLEFSVAAGGAPLFFGPRAIEKLKSRKTVPATYYLDMNLVGDYWGWFGKRSYHHTGMVSTW